MSENISVRKFTDLPEAESIKDGDKVLINSDGEARQLAANKLGGGGGEIIYLQVIGDPTFDENGKLVNLQSYCYADEALQTQLTYAQGKNMLMHGATLYVKGDAVTAMTGISDNMTINSPIAVYHDVAKSILVVVVVPDGTNTLGELIFTDTNLG